MNLVYKSLMIREAERTDAEQLCTWWNDGSVMAHAGFPNGLGTTAETVADQIQKQDRMQTCRHIILQDQVPIGEMNYRRISDEVCEIGIKICRTDKQNHGIGKVVLSMFLDGLFHEMHFKTIILDTNLNNKRAQHVYEQLGFRKVRVNVDSWRDQLGNLQSAVDYELDEAHFVSYCSE